MIIIEYFYKRKNINENIIQNFNNVNVKNLLAFL